ncbi:MAG: SMP-30/gluconolactonase/LRE family protein [Kutzneria sp.]|nr:SMP-30/gluconolactonase/LRE family protein [Kutzneria sp.]MBV9845317.1 SMP-30/gluconolactonase/LRE family protein [Kutzneria sp.]
MTIVLAAISATALLPSSPARAEKSCYPDSMVGSAPTLHPEGIAYDPTRERFLVGSVKHGTVSIVNLDGSVNTLVSDPALITTMGITVDTPRNRILVVNGDIGIADRTSPQTNGKTAGLGIYDLASGQRIAYVDLGSLDTGHGHFGNDVTVGPDGSAFVTDSVSGAVYEVSLTGAPSILVRDDQLVPVGKGNGANGIVWNPDGFLLVAQSSARALYRVALDGSRTVARVAVDAPIGAPDGLLLDGPSTIQEIDNTSANRVVTLDSTDHWRTATVANSLAWPDPAPTTIARGACGTYVLTGRLDLLLSGKPSDEYRIRRLG